MGGLENDERGETGDLVLPAARFAGAGAGESRIGARYWPRGGRSGTLLFSSCRTRAPRAFEESVEGERSRCRPAAAIMSTGDLAVAVADGCSNRVPGK